jgi:hypothetical protein
VRVSPVVLGPDPGPIVGHRGRLAGPQYLRSDAALLGRPARSQWQRDALGALPLPGADYRGRAIAFESHQSGPLRAEHATGLGRRGTEQHGWRDPAGNQRGDPPQRRLLLGYLAQLLAARLRRISHAPDRYVVTRTPATCRTEPPN